jgi:RecA/RadA recombinase
MSRGTSTKKSVPKLSKRQARKAAEEKNKVSGMGVAAWRAEVNKSEKFKGIVQVGPASELCTPYYLRRPTGVMGVDLALGGGWHAGGVVQITGAESVGKTYMAYRTGGQVQRNYGDESAILIVCTEILTDKTFARKAGLHIAYSPTEIAHFNDMRVKRGQLPYTREELADLGSTTGFVEYAKGATGDKLLDSVLNALEKRAFHLIIVEALGAMITPDQDAGDVGDRVFGGTAGMLTNFMNKAYPLFMRHAPDGSLLETTILGINQARAEMNNPTGRGPKTHAAAGAFAWKHAQLASIELNKGAPIWADAQHTKQLGREVNWNLVKGKAGTHDGKKGSYNYYHVPTDDPILWSNVVQNGATWGIDTVTDLVDSAKGLGIIQVSGSWLSWEHEGAVMAKTQGSEAMADILVSDPELEQKLRDQCLVVANLPIRFR